MASNGTSSFAKKHSTRNERADALELKALSVGRVVLASLERGRARAIERAKQIGAANSMKVIALATLDAEAGRSPRGRAGRIARKLGGLLKERSVRKILARLSSRTDSLGHTVRNFKEVSNDK
jgi:hypothetical protein